MKMNIKYRKSTTRQSVRTKTWLTVILLSLLSVQFTTAQVMVPFEQRTSTYSPDKKIYNIKGDFQLIGNTNLTLQTYYASGNSSSNNNSMRFVDIDSDPTTINSSSATLQLSTENSCNPACSNIIYAGLYWTGRAHNGTSANSWLQGANINDRNNNNNTFNGQTLTITAEDNGSQGGDNGRLAIYTFTPTTGDAVVFRFYSWRTGGYFSRVYHGLVTVQVGSGTPMTISGSVTSSGDDNYVFTFDTHYPINTGTETIYINSLKKRATNNGITNNYSASVSTGGKLLDKSVVRLKHASASAYTTISADDENFTKNIYFPTATEDYMYSAYAEVTDYVKEHGIGEYFVADIALNEGNGGGTGFYGGWGMIVVYENALMKWRDITIFDGHAYVRSTTTSHELPISGFRAAQNGPINVKLGLIAGEGDANINGDYFSMRKNNGSYEDISHSANTTGNFFNSTINTGGNARNPNLTNNTGLDISMFNINNGDKRFITNNQTSTTFRYGSTQDTYIIPMIAMAVDAYVPDVECSNTSLTVGGVPFDPSITSVKPGEEIEYKLEIKNNGNEAVRDLVIRIPVPFTSEYVSYSASAAYATGLSGTVSYDPTLGSTGTIIWNIGNLPLQDGVLATLTYKFKITTNCDILSNANCVKMTIGGTSSGTGVTSGTSFADQKFIWGFNTEGDCVNTPIYAPVTLNIDADDYRAEHCPEIADHIIKLYYCGVTEDKIAFSEVAAHFPDAAKFYSAVEFYDDEELALEGLVRPATGATQYTTATGFPNTIGEATYYAIAPASNTSCYWQFTITVEVICNVWHGTFDNDWNTPDNWTNNRVPATGDDIEFATEANNPTGTATNSGPAIRDLHLPTGEEKVIGDLINLSDKALVISAGTSLKVGGTVTGSETAANVNKLRILAASGRSNGSFMLQNYTSQGTTPIYATVQMYSPACQGAYVSWTDNIEGSPTKDQTLGGSYRWQYFGSPVESMEVNPGLNGSWVREYSEARNGATFYDKWIPLANGAVLNKLKGYEITQTVARDMYFQGKLVIGEQTLPITALAAEVGNTGIRYGLGYNIFGNPFTSAVPIADMVFPANVEETVYLYNTGTFGSWGNNHGSTTGSSTTAGQYRAIPKNVAGLAQYKEIPSMNGFLLLYNAAYGSTTNMTLPYSISVRNTEVQTAPRAPLSYLEIELSSASTRDRMWLVSQPGTTAGFDNGWDGRKFFATPTAFIFAPTPDGNMEISTNSTLIGTPISFVANTEFEYTLTVKKSNIDQHYSNLTLVDLWTGVETPLTDEVTTYDFTAANIGTADQRFAINGAPGVITDNDELAKHGSAEAYVVDGKIYINNNTASAATLNLFDEVGRQLYSGVIPTMSVEALPLCLAQGVYIINIVAGKESYNTKVIVNK